MLSILAAPPVSHFERGGGGVAVVCVRLIVAARTTHDPRPTVTYDSRCSLLRSSAESTDWYSPWLSTDFLFVWGLDWVSKTNLLVIQLPKSVGRAVGS